MAKAPRRKEPPAIAFIGLGIARKYLHEVAPKTNVRLVGICDVNPDRLDETAQIIAQRSNGRQKPEKFTDYHKMIEQVAPDGVVLSVPNYLHKSITIDLLRAGRHVLCDKPMAMNVAEAKEMIAAAKRYKRRLMINLSFRFEPESHAMKEIVDSGELGEIYFARTGWMRQRGIPLNGGWFYDKTKSGGGPLIDLGVHRIDLAWYLMGEPKVKSVSGQTFCKFGKSVVKDFSVEDLAAGFVRFVDGRCLQVAASWQSYCEEPEWMWTEIYGTKGGATQRNINGTYTFQLQLHKSYGDYHTVSRPLRANPFKPSAMDHFFECVQYDREPIPSAEKGLEIQKILNGLYESARTGREVVFR